VPTAADGGAAATEGRHGCEPGTVPNFEARGGAGPAFLQSACRAWHRLRTHSHAPEHSTHTIGRSVATAHARAIRPTRRPVRRRFVRVAAAFPRRTRSLFRANTHARTHSRKRGVRTHTRSRIRIATLCDDAKRKI